MIDTSMKILELIKNGYTINEMILETGLSNRQLYNYLILLKNMGFLFDRKYYYSGDIVYLPKNYDSLVSNNSGVDIITSSLDKEFRALLVADLHIGSKKERFDAIIEMYEYCIRRGINIIIIAGDLINGMLGVPSIHGDISEQIEYMIKNYPYDKNILNFTVLGNHDLDLLNTNNQDLSEILMNYRHDIVSLGYGVGEINIKNDKIIVQHPHSSIMKKDTKVSSLVLKGHSHKMKLVNKGNRLFLKIPTLSDDFKNGNQMVPSAIEMNIKFKHGYFDEIGFKQLIFINNQFYPISEIYSCINGRGKNCDYSSGVNLEEERGKRRILVPNKNGLK